MTLSGLLLSLVTMMILQYSSQGFIITPAHTFRRNQVEFRATKLTNDVQEHTLSSDEAVKSQSNLKVPSTAWRWPPAWPFPENYLEFQTTAKPELDRDPKVDELFFDHVNPFFAESDRVLVVDNDQSSRHKGKYGLQYSVSSFKQVVNAGNSLEFMSDEFDKVVMLSGIEHLNSPTDFFREIWRVLKPSGRCFVCFYGEPRLPKDILSVAMWETMNDEQKIWIAGAYYHYSAVGGWENIEGYDIVGNSGNGTLNFQKSDQTNITAYIVQAQKIDIQDFNITGDNTLDSSADIFMKRSLGLKHVDPDDRKYLSYRLASQLVKSASVDEIVTISSKLRKLSSIYKVLKEVKEIVVPSPVKALLATLIADEWDGSEQQVTALRMSLGLEPPDLEFWSPISASSMQLRPKEKIYFLADVVPKFGNAKYSSLLSSLPSLMTEGLATLQARFQQIEASQLQSFLADLVVSDFLNSPNPSVEKMKRFIESITEQQLQGIIQEINET